jgi:hypothetical protein
VDTTEPEIELLYKDGAGNILSEKDYYNELVRVVAIVTESNPAEGDPDIIITKDGAEIPIRPEFTEEDGVFEAEYVLPGDGVYTVGVSCADLAGNGASKDAAFTSDTAAPDITSILWRDKDGSSTAPEIADGAVSDEDMTLEAAAYDINLDAISWTLSGELGTNAPSGAVSAVEPTGTATFDIVSPFSGTVTVTATDKAGNSRTAAYSNVVVDGEIPAVPGFSAVAAGAGYESGVWTKDDVTLGIYGADQASGLTLLYQSSGDGLSWPAEWTAYTGALQYTSNCSAYLRAKAVSGAGLESGVSSLQRQLLKQ